MWIKIKSFFISIFCIIKEFCIRLFCNRKTYKMHYLTSDEKPCLITYAYPFQFGDNKVLSNEYKDGVGTIEFEKPLTYISTYTFVDSENLISITIPETVENIEVGAFNCNIMRKFFGKFSSPDNLSLIIGNRLVAAALGGVCRYVIPEGVQEIPNIFSGIKRKDLEVIINHNCGDPWDFEYSYIQLVSNIEDVKEDSFRNNVFSRITLGEKTKSLGKHSFLRSRAQYLYDIPEYHAYDDYCQIICEAQNPPILGDDFVFGSIYPGTAEYWPDSKFFYQGIYVPETSILAYKKEWSDLYDYIQSFSIL